MFKYRRFWRGYYLATEGKVGGLKYLHSISCGFVGDKELLYIHMFHEDMPDTKGINQESFDLSLDATDNLLSLETMKPSVVPIVEGDREEGLSDIEILERRAGLLIPEFMGFTFEEVLSNNPGILIEEEKEDEEGNKYTVSNIKRSPYDKLRED